VFCIATQGCLVSKSKSNFYRRINLLKLLTFFSGMLLLAICLTGCSVGMALSGSDAPDLSVVQPGADRGTVELQLGSPVDVVTNDEGCTVCKYEFETGNEPSAGRAVFHGAMDVLTFGAWEIIGTPIEGFQGKKRQVMITYDQTDKITEVN
jgi:hypothetical protein